jgi:hypothetical protein
LSWAPSLIELVTEPLPDGAAHDRSTRRIPVVYIAGPGRSGSTLLDLVLGQAEGVVSVGELRNLWSRGLKDGWPCGCGKPVLECPFWSAVLIRAFGSIDAASSAAMTELQNRTVRTRHLPRLWWDLAAHRSDPAVQSYAEMLSRLYRAVAEISGAQVVVDSSKHPADAVVASTIKEVELRVLHLVRDPRAVTYSWTRPKDSPRESITLAPQSPILCSVRWTVWNTIIGSLLARRLGSRYRVVRYEDLMDDPSRTLADVLGFMGLPVDALALRGTTIELRTTHSVCGNPARFTTGSVELVADLRWMDGLEPSLRVIATVGALPVMHRYGYTARLPGRRAG